MTARGVAQQHHGVSVRHNGHRPPARPGFATDAPVDTPIEAPAPPATPPVETEVIVRGVGSAADYSIAFSGPILETRMLDSDDGQAGDRSGAGSVSAQDEDVWVGRAGVVRVANDSGSDGPIEVELQGQTVTVEPGGVAARRFVPGPAGPLQLPETVLGVRSDAAVAGSAALGLGAAAAAFLL